MRILVVGPGAIGSLLAERLSHTRHAAMLLARNERQAAALRRDGIRIVRPDHTDIFRVPALASSAGTSFRSSYAWTADIAVYCVKTYDLNEAFEGSWPYLGRRTVIVSCQNGIGNLDRLIAAGAVGPVLCCVTGLGAFRLGYGNVAWAGAGETWVAPHRPADMRHAAAFAHILREGGMAVRSFPDARVPVWSKAIVNAAINPVSAWFRLRNGEILTHPAALAMARRAAREGQRVAEAAGVELLYEDAFEEVCRVCRATAGNRSSMLQDVERGGPTEIASITGEIVAAGKRLGIATPINNRLLARLTDTNLFKAAICEKTCRLPVVPGPQCITAHGERL